YRFFNCAARIPPGPGFGTIISSVDGGCSHPGTRIARFRLTNTILFRPNSTMKHVWNDLNGAFRITTIIQAYVPAGTGPALVIDNPGSNLHFNSPGTCITQPTGLIVNPDCNLPTADAGSPYVACGTVQLNGVVGG